MFCVETLSFLPNVQSDGRDLARQAETRQMRFHPSGNARLVEIFKRPGRCCGSHGCTFEDIFQIVIVVDVQPADGEGLLGTLELATDKAIFPAGVGPQCQAAVGPELPFGAEAVGRLHQRNQQSSADGADRGNLPQ
jgi:hypothetical protein